MTAVSPDPQRGQATCSVPNSARRLLPWTGGAMPYSSSLRRPSDGAVVRAISPRSSSRRHTSAIVERSRATV